MSDSVSALCLLIHGERKRWGERGRGREKKIGGEGSDKERSRKRDFIDGGIKDMKQRWRSRKKRKSRIKV